MPKQQRFYDLDISMSQAVALLLLFPDEMQAVIADGLSYIAEKEFRANDIIRELKSLGRDKVLAIFNSKRKRREYDQNAAVHRALNYLLVLSEENRQLISRKILSLMGYLQEYLHTCRTYDNVPSLETFESITAAYIQLGAMEAKKLLTSLESEFRHHLMQVSQPTAMAAGDGGYFVTEAIQVEGSGLRLRRQLISRPHPRAGDA
jgi:hypothetical protein